MKPFIVMLTCKNVHHRHPPHTGWSLSQWLQTIWRVFKQLRRLWSALALVGPSRCLSQHHRWICGDTTRADVSPPVVTEKHQTIKDNNSCLFLFLTSVWIKINPAFAFFSRILIPNVHRCDSTSNLTQNANLSTISAAHWSLTSPKRKKARKEKKTPLFS